MQKLRCVRGAPLSLFRWSPLVSTEQVKWLIAAHHVDSCEIVFINTIAISDVVHSRKVHNWQFNELSIHVENNRETRNSSTMYCVEALNISWNAKYGNVFFSVVVVIDRNTFSCYDPRPQQFVHGIFDWIRFWVLVYSIHARHPKWYEHKREEAYYATGLNLFVGFDCRIQTIGKRCSRMAATKSKQTTSQYATATHIQTTSKLATTKATSKPIAQSPQTSCIESLPFHSCSIVDPKNEHLCVTHQIDSLRLAYEMNTIMSFRLK